LGIKIVTTSAIKQLMTKYTCGMKVAPTFTNLGDYSPFSHPLLWMNMNMIWTSCTTLCEIWLCNYICNYTYNYFMDNHMMPSVLTTWPSYLSTHR
jgi:hypothetical protein